MPRLNTKPIPVMTPEYIARFWSLVEKTDGCWLWKGTTNETKYHYGLFTVADGSRHKRHRILAHRVAYKLQYGIDPGALLVCHACDEPRCVFGPHLFLGNSIDNNKDRHSKGRSRLPTRESRQPSYKLNDSAVRTIRARHLSRTVRSGISIALLASEYGVSLTTIENVIYGISWTHVT